MNDILQDQQHSWKACTAKEICAERMPKHKYRAIKTDEEYFDNIRINAFGGRHYEPAPKRTIFGGIRITL